MRRTTSSGRLASRSANISLAQIPYDGSVSVRATRALSSCVWRSAGAAGAWARLGAGWPLFADQAKAFKRLPRAWLAAVLRGATSLAALECADNELGPSALTALAEALRGARCLTALGLARNVRTPPRKKVEKLMTAVDKDGNGTIDQAEFKKVLEALVADQDRVYCMTASHRDALLSMLPEGAAANVDATQWFGALTSQSCRQLVAVSPDLYSRSCVTNEFFD